MAPEHKTWALIGNTSFSPQLCALCGKDRLSFAAKDSGDRRACRGRGESRGTEQYSKAS
jgi:hypothetical protein